MARYPRVLLVVVGFVWVAECRNRWECGRHATAHGVHVEGSRMWTYLCELAGCCAICEREVRDGYVGGWNARWMKRTPFFGSGEREKLENQRAGFKPAQRSGPPSDFRRGVACAGALAASLTPLSQPPAFIYFQLVGRTLGQLAPGVGAWHAARDQGQAQPPQAGPLSVAPLSDALVALRPHHGRPRPLISCILLSALSNTGSFAGSHRRCMLDRSGTGAIWLGIALPPGIAFGSDAQHKGDQQLRWLLLCVAGCWLLVLHHLALLLTAAHWKSRLEHQVAYVFSLPSPYPSLFLRRVTTVQSRTGTLSEMFGPSIR